MNVCMFFLNILPPNTLLKFAFDACHFLTKWNFPWYFELLESSQSYFKQNNEHAVCFTFNSVECHKKQQNWC